jgi:hypothetical protein
MWLKRFLFLIWNYWPPFWGAGIQIQHLSKDIMSARMRLKRRPWTRNLVGTQFGGSMYAMTDPIYMAMLINHLGKGFIVWDKAGTIQFRKPGRTDLFADFKITQADLDEIRAKLDTHEKIDWERDVLIKDKEGNLIAEVHKVIHIRRKK